MSMFNQAQRFILSIGSSLYWSWWWDADIPLLFECILSMCCLKVFTSWVWVNMEQYGNEGYSMKMRAIVLSNMLIE